MHLNPLEYTSEMSQDSEERPSKDPDKEANNKYKWNVVKRKRSPPNEGNPEKRQNTNTSPPSSEGTRVTNKYTVLTPMDQDQEEDVMDSEQAAPTQAKIKPVPIVFPSVDNIAEFLKEINHVIGEPEYTHTTKNGKIRIHCKEIDSYRELIRYCNLKQIVHQTWQLKHERAFRCVIEGLHHSTSTTLISDELRKYGHTVRNIIVARHRIEKYPIDYFFVDLEPNTINREVYDIEFIGNAKIKIAPPRTAVKDDPQCHRCQEYGHTKNFCKNPWRCHKCAGDHPYTECNKSKDTPPKCCFCSGPHPSNYRGCPNYRTRRGNAEMMRRPQNTFRFNPNDFPATLNNGPTPHQFTPYHPNPPSYGRTQDMDDRLFKMMEKIEVAISNQINTMNILVGLIQSMMNNNNNKK